MTLQNQTEARADSDITIKMMTMRPCLEAQLEPFGSVFKIPIPEYEDLDELFSPVPTHNVWFLQSIVISPIFWDPDLGVWTGFLHFQKPSPDPKLSTHDAIRQQPALIHE